MSAKIYEVMAGVLILVVGAAGGAYVAGSRHSTGGGTGSYDPASSTIEQDFPADGSAPSLKDLFGVGSDSTFKEIEGITFELNWPAGTNSSLGPEEAEIIVNNGSKKTVDFSEVTIDFMVDGKVAGVDSGTWEKFPDARSWDKIDYVNIAAQYYQGEPLVLEPGQKGKIHYHYIFSVALSDDQQQVANINLVFTLDGEAQIIKETLTRDTAMVATEKNTDSEGSSSGSTASPGSASGGHN